MPSIRVEYPQDKALEATGKDIDEMVDAVNVALALLWGKRNIGSNAISLEEMDEWLKGPSDPRG
ncbi:hypothetical protein [Streptomyces sp. NPDC005385]|uniref:hypothetical protein n=1 Tax=Streptomyces sp. NPDC005385 TaxID=3157039 RepID=UPI0033A10512